MTRGIKAAKKGFVLSIEMAVGESKVPKPHETPVKKSRKRKPPKVSFSMVEARTPELSQSSPCPSLIFYFTTCV